MMSLKMIKLISIFCVIICFSSATPNAAKSTNLSKLSTANNDLGLKLYKQLIKGNSENVFFSPFSLSNALGMLAVGARGNTAKELRSVLGYDAAQLPDSDVPTSFGQYLDLILSTNQKEDPDYVLNLGNEMLLREGLEVNSTYEQEIKNNFHAILEEVDFQHNAAEIVRQANDFVDQQTHGKITKLLDSVSPASAMLILNAIYFKGTWQYQFEEEMTMPQKFYNGGSDSNAKEVPLMTIKGKFRYSKVGDLQAIELPYNGNNISMMILLPQQRNGLSKIEDSISPDEISSIQERMYLTDVVVTLPKFKIEYSKVVNPDIKALGAENMFVENLANFTGISHAKGLSVSEILHKAVVEVNEKGSEAAAATAGIMRIMLPLAPPPPPVQFIADHPFVFAILDKRNDMLLFLGRVNEL